VRRRRKNQRRAQTISRGFAPQARQHLFYRICLLFLAKPQGLKMLYRGRAISVPVAWLPITVQVPESSPVERNSYMPMPVCSPS